MSSVDAEKKHHGPTEQRTYHCYSLCSLALAPRWHTTGLATLIRMERMKGSFAQFTEVYTGKVFIVFSLKGEIGNPEIIQEIADEIIRLQA